jgi:Flp pilus assembly protein TadG
MRWLTRDAGRRIDDEGGAVAIIVALLLTVLLGSAAFAVDMSSMHLQRRQHQVSADAGALAIAQDCARGECPADENARAAEYTAANEAGNGTPGNFGASASVAEYPASGTVRVTVSGENQPIFRQILQQGPTDIAASATAIWGSPSRLDSVLPITFSVCEYEYYAQAGLAPQPPYKPNPPNSYPPASLEVGLLMRTPQWETTGITCARGPAGQIAAGSFSWLTTASGSCKTSTAVDQWFDGDTGNAPQDTNNCRPAFETYRDSVVYLPIYSAIARNSDGSGGLPTGTNAWFYIDSYVAFYLTGYEIPSIGNNVRSIATNRKCSDIAPPSGPGGGAGTNPCISGFFTSGLIPASELPAGAIIPGDVSGSVIAVQLVE